jgi:hypothetical protein
MVAVVCCSVAAEDGLGTTGVDMECCRKCCWWLKGNIVATISRFSYLA